MCCRGGSTGDLQIAIAIDDALANSAFSIPIPISIPMESPGTGASSNPDSCRISVQRKLGGLGVDFDPQMVHLAVSSSRKQFLASDAHAVPHLEVDSSTRAIATRAEWFPASRFSIPATLTGVGRG